MHVHSALTKTAGAPRRIYYFTSDYYLYYLAVDGRRGADAELRPEERRAVASVRLVAVALIRQLALLAVTALALRADGADVGALRESAALGGGSPAGAALLPLLLLAGGPPRKLELRAGRPPTVDGTEGRWTLHLPCGRLRGRPCAGPCVVPCVVPCVGL